MHGEASTMSVSSIATHASEPSAMRSARTEFPAATTTTPFPGSTAGVENESKTGAGIGAVHRTAPVAPSTAKSVSAVPRSPGAYTTPPAVTTPPGSGNVAACPLYWLNAHRWMLRAGADAPAAAHRRRGPAPYCVQSSAIAAAGTITAPIAARVGRPSVHST